jgi:GR25 family glycosyltransferase involved in LPS biosynthesis
MFSISGFARGAALLSENEGMDPVPVCVILEDDAVLTDRFSERLSSLLEELPRDFHFCSLGYSRPKAAPMIEYSTHLSIPSCLWYLTGYVLSLEGARHLIASLPVSGPVDSWIGLKMCGNWDNQFGDIMGVGKGGTSHGKVARKDLAKIMKFRAFAAVVPLCAQKVGSSASSTMTRGGWRDRDTDITYSG